ncbi:MAG TPA: glycosyltransferase family 2 protein [Candidatus Acidoferrum sp.]|nr:glycosyltransferase family 2 protein [Candidatus Acidoferrum sp.]
MSDISVIIVSWNAHGHLRDCLDSIRKTGGSWIREVVVVDNASSDGSPEMVARQFPEVKLVRNKENLGFARANNLGIKISAGAYLALINSDVVVHPGCLKRLAAFLDTRPDVGLVGPKILGRDGLLQRTCRLLPGVWNIICETLALDRLFSKWPLFSGREMRHWNQDTEAEVEVLSGCFWLVRRSAVERVGGLDERFFFYAEDIDWCKRFNDAGWKVCFFPDAQATHFGGGSSLNVPLRYSIEMVRANLAYWKKHHGTLGRITYRCLAIVYHLVRLLPLSIMRLTGLGDPSLIRYKFSENFVCFRWLLTGKEV